MLGQASHFCGRRPANGADTAGGGHLSFRCITHKSDWVIHSESWSVLEKEGSLLASFKQEQVPVLSSGGPTPYLQSVI